MTPDQAMWLLQVLEVIRDLLLIMTVETTLVTIVYLVKATGKTQ